MLVGNASAAGGDRLGSGVQERLEYFLRWLEVCSDPGPGRFRQKPVYAMSVCQFHQEEPTIVLLHELGQPGVPTVEQCLRRMCISEAHQPNIIEVVPPRAGGVLESLLNRGLGLRSNPLHVDQQVHGHALFLGSTPFNQLTFALCLWAAEQDGRGYLRRHPLLNRRRRCTPGPCRAWTSAN